METRSVAVWNLEDLGGLVSHTNVEQTAIPWCTTHDLPLEAFRNDVAACYDVQAYPPDCVSSLGGPGHKWWKDE